MSSQNPYDPDLGEPESDNTSLSRRDMLKHGTVAMVGGGAALLGGGGPAFAQALAVVTERASRTAGWKFRALVRYRTNLDVQELTLLPIQPRVAFFGGTSSERISNKRQHPTPEDDADPKKE